MRFSKLTAVVVLTLALGIGANAAIFSAIQKSPAASLPYHHPEQLAEIANAYFRKLPSGATPGDYFDWRQQNASLSKLGAFIEELFQGFDLIGDGESRRTQ